MLPLLMNLRFIPWFKLRGGLKRLWTMAFAPSPTSTINSNFSLIDSISEITTLDMSENNDNNNQPASNEEDFPSRPGSVLEKEGSLNGSMTTIVVSPPSFSSTLFFYTRLSCLQVNDIQFRLDSHFLERESETLKAIITSSESDSIRLNDVSAAEFRALWRFFYEG